MKLAFLVHTNRDYEETIEMINQLTKQGDHVFIMINDNDLRDKIAFVYTDYLRVHVSRIQEYAQEGDLSLARGTIIQMKEAVERDDFDYFINLTDGMLPLKTRSEIIAFLEEHKGKDFYYEATSTYDQAALNKKSKKYYPFTNALDFQRNNFLRSLSKGSGALFSCFGIRRKTDENYRIGSPWFILCKESAKKLAEHFDYVSESFKLSWYAEEQYIPMMMHKYVYVDGRNDDHMNQDMRVVGENGQWVESSEAKVLKEEVLKQHPEALFGGKITAEDTLYLYNEYFDIYNRDYDKQSQKEKRDVDPNALIDALTKSSASQQ